jgi:NAD(P)H-hydrate epimerase
MEPLSGTDPILTCVEAGEFERWRFQGDPAREWPAMQAAGRGVGEALLADVGIAGLDTHQPHRVLILVGKGHNGGDAMLAGMRLLAETCWSIEVGFVFGQNRLRPLALAAWQALQQATVPVVLDADALLPELVSQGTMPRILTPHAGEYQRIQPYDTSAPDRTECVWVRKGPVTRIHCDQTVYHVIDGGPELARGGSGDVLAGLIGGRLAEHPDELMRAAVEGACWHGRAALRVARHRGETAIRTTGLLDELNVALREN